MIQICKLPWTIMLLRSLSTKRCPLWPKWPNLRNRPPPNEWLWPTWLSKDREFSTREAKKVSKELSVWTVSSMQQQRWGRIFNSWGVQQFDKKLRKKETCRMLPTRGTTQKYSPSRKLLPSWCLKHGFIILAKLIKLSRVSSKQWKIILTVSIQTPLLLSNREIYLIIARQVGDFLLEMPII